jgi:hypothetical protein
LSARRTTALIIVLSQLLLVAAVYAGVFSSRHASFTVNIADVKLVEIADPPYPLCVGVSRAGRQAVYYNDFESIPLDWVVFNGTLTPRGFIAPQGYWGLTSGYKGSGLRGFPLVWQVREHKTLRDRTPDVRFIPQTTNAIRIDSYTAGDRSYGNGYLFIIAPRELFNNTVVNNRFDAYTSHRKVRTFGYIDLVNATIDRRDDATIFSTYGDTDPYWRNYGTPSYIWLYNVSQARGPISYNVNSSVGDLSGYAPYLTYVITMIDFWDKERVYFDVFWVAIYDNATEALVYNFTFPYNRYSVILERSGTTGDYGYLDFGMTGFTGAYWNQDLSSIFTTTGAWFSSKVNLRGGVGWAGILLTNTTHHYVVAINTTGWLTINYYNGLTWTTLASWSIPGYTNNTWYIPIVYFKRDPDAITFTIYLYDAQGARLLYVGFDSTTPTLIFTPTYIGLSVNTTNRLYLDAAFDDFLFAPADPINAEFVNLPGPSYTVAIYDNLGLHVSNATSTTTSVNVSLVTDLVLGTGYNGRFIIYYPNMTACLVHTVPSTEVVLGGDTYIVHWRNTSVNTLDMVVHAYIGYGSNLTTGPLFNITIYPGDTRYTYLWLDQTNSAIPSTLYLNLTLVNATGAASTKIQVHGGLVISDTTSAIPLAGTGNYVHIEGYFTQPMQSATLRLYIVACSSPTLAARYIVKVTVYLSTIE